MNSVVRTSSSSSSSRWIMGAVAAGLVAAGAIGGGLISSHMSSRAAPSEANANAAKVPVVVAANTNKKAAAALCSSCGVVESVQAQKREGDASGVGAVAGGVVGGLIGNQMGGGNGKKAMTVVGAVGGGLAGHEIEKQQRAHTVYVVRVRMEDGSLRSFTRSNPMDAGQRVKIENGKLVLQA